MIIVNYSLNDLLFYQSLIIELIFFNSIHLMHRLIVI